MTDPIALWIEDGAAHGWTMPRVPGWWRWWGVRHVRWWWLGFQLYRIGWPLDGSTESFLEGGNNQPGYDRWVLFGIWHGLELKQDKPGGGE